MGFSSDDDVAATKGISCRGDWSERDKTSDKELYLNNYLAGPFLSYRRVIVVCEKFGCG